MSPSHFRSLSLALLCALTVSPSAQHTVGYAQQKVTSTSKAVDRFDSALWPIKGLRLKAALEAFKDDAVALVQLIRRADKSNLLPLTLDTLKQLQVKHPKNANLPAAYCFTYDAGGSAFQYRSKAVFAYNQKMAQAYIDSMNNAYRLDPKLWLTYSLNGYALADTRESGGRGMEMLKKAVELEPNSSLPHYFLARGYMVYGQPFSSWKKAVEELRKAQVLGPPNADVCFWLFDTYDLRIPNRAKAKQAAEAFVAVVPPSYKIKPVMLARLAKYGVKPK